MDNIRFRWFVFLLAVFCSFIVASALTVEGEQQEGECISADGEDNDLQQKGKDCGCDKLSRSNAANTGNDEYSTDENAEEENTTPVYRELLAALKSGKLQEYKYTETELLEIPGGEFTMGTDDPAIPEDGEMPARRVKVSTFLLQKYEVSNRQFAQFVLETGYQTESERFNWSFCFEGTLSKEVNERITSAVEAVPWWLPVEGSDWFHPNGPDSDIFTLAYLTHPVVHVSHNDARAYCKWLGLRLPTEAEFERASGGGQPKGTMFPWGNDLVPNGVYRANLWQGSFPGENTGEDGYLWSAPVDSFGPQNQFGLYNIIGNVWEWVADAWVVRHSKSTVLEDPLFEIQGRVDDPTVERTKKGGSYMCHKSYCYRYRVVSRSHNSADSAAQNLGIRCATSIDE